MNTCHRPAACLLLCFTVIAAPSVRAQDATLRYRWTQGEEFRYRYTQQSTMTMSGTGLAPGGESAVDSTLTQRLRTIVDDVAADGTVTLRQVIDAVRIDINAPFGRSVFDSAATGSIAADDRLSQSITGAYSAMIGQAITLVIAPSGTVQKVEGMSAILERMLKAQPGTMPADALERLKNSFSDDAARYMFERGFASFPERPLKPGDTWDDQLTVNLPMFGAMSTFRTWTFHGIERRDGIETARITSTFTIKSDPAPGAASLPFSLEPGENSGESEMLFDVARGRLVRLTTHMTQQMKMTMRGAGGPGGNMQTLGNTTVVLELLDAAGR